MQDVEKNYKITQNITFPEAWKLLETAASSTTYTKVNTNENQENTLRKVGENGRVDNSNK